MICRCPPGARCFHAALRPLAGVPAHKRLDLVPRSTFALTLRNRRWPGGPSDIGQEVLLYDLAPRSDGRVAVVLTCSSDGQIADGAPRTDVTPIDVDHMLRLTEQNWRIVDGDREAFLRVAAELGAEAHGRARITPPPAKR